jgi:hypothetical protein
VVRGLNPEVQERSNVDLCTCPEGHACYATAMTLTNGQLTALRIMVERAQLKDTDFLNIADAQSLTTLGLAQRSRDGWTLTPAGARALSEANRQEQARGEGHAGGEGRRAAELDEPGDGPDS